MRQRGRVPCRSLQSWGCRTGLASARGLVWDAVCGCVYDVVCACVRVHVRLCCRVQDATHVVNLAQALEYGGDYEAACTLLKSFLDRWVTARHVLLPHPVSILVFPPCAASRPLRFPMAGYSSVAEFGVVLLYVKMLVAGPFGDGGLVCCALRL